jgi:hypothetical protein
MWKLTAALIVALLITTAWTAQGRGQLSSSSEAGVGISEEGRQRLTAALALDKAHQPKAALDALGPLAHDTDAPWQVRNLVGELYEKSGDFGNAARFYESIIRELGPKVSSLPGNLYFRLATVEFEDKDYQRAIPSLMLALKYRGYEDDGRIYKMLAESYKEIDQPNMADRSMLLSAATSPKIRPDVTVIDLSAWTEPSPPLPNVPAPDLLREILVAAPPANPPTEANFPLSALTLKYAELLDNVGWSRAATRYRSAAIDLVYEEASSDIDDNENDKGLRELARLSTLPGYSDLPLKVRAVGLQLEMQAHTNAGRFSHAAAALERLAQTKSYERSNVADIAIKLQRLAFSNVSFDPATGKPRSTDPATFLDTAHLTVVVEKADGKKPSLSPKEQAERAKSPYGEVSQSEDWAEISSAVIVTDKYPAARRELIDILSRCLKEHRFELPVKFSLHMLASSFLNQKLKDGTTLSDRLRREIFADGKSPSSVTLDAYTAGEKLAKLIKSSQ